MIGKSGQKGFSAVGSLFSDSLLQPTSNWPDLYNPLQNRDRQMRMTVVQVLPALDIGGVERGTLEVAAGLVAHGSRSIVISAGGRLVKQLLAAGSEHVCWPIGRKSPLTLGLIPRLRRFLLEQRVDILHLRSRMPAWVAWLAWRGMDPRKRPGLITTVHGHYSVSRYSAIMTRGERVIAISEFIRDYIVQNYPQAPEGCIRLIHRGVDPQAFPYGFKPPRAWLEKWYADFPSVKGKYLLTLPGRVSRRKGIEEFIQLIAMLKRRSLPVHGLIVGNTQNRHGAFVGQLKNAINESGLDSDISLLGPRADIREILAVSGAILSLSNKPEAFGRTVLEALSLGIPAFGYNHGGTMEVLNEIFPQGLVPFQDLAVLADKLEQTKTCPPVIAATHPFTLQKMIGETIGVYQELVSAHGSSC